MAILKTNTYYFICFLFTIVSIKTTAQEKSKTIFGAVYASKIPISDVHIINLNKKTGTISNINGEFEISVEINDTLFFSSIQYKSKKVKITEALFNSKQIIISLDPFVNELNEVFLSGLTGDLKYDLRNKVKDTNPRHTFKFNRSQVTKLAPDYSTDFSKAPDARRLTDPTAAGGGVGASMSIPDKRLEAEKKLKKELKQKQHFAYQLKKEFGINFFVNDLKIPEDKINLFIDYCEYRSILKKYYSNKVLEVIKILQEESATYNDLEK